jgi:5-methylcytosine-specific restriction enzyme A
MLTKHTTQQDDAHMSTRADNVWYASQRWRLHRRRPQLAREPLCEWCKWKGLTVEAEVVHHALAHGGDPEKFWHGELVSLCKPCHDRDAQGIERRGYSNDVDATGWPVDARHPSNRKRK